MKHAIKCDKFTTHSKYALLLAITLPAVSVSTVTVVCAQSSSLPATNMGKFVHQPGDNQYSNKTQAERHAPPGVVPSSTLMAGPAQSVGYVPVPRPVKPDPTLSYISADEPIVLAGFPPLPDRAELAGSGDSWSAGGIQTRDSGAAEPNTTHKKIQEPTHQHYNHAKAGEFAPQQTRHYRSSNDSTNTLRGGSNTAVSPTSSLGKEPPLDPRLDQGINVDAPTPVTVKQPTTQDLSLPDDEFDGNAHQKKNASGTHSMLNRVEQQTIINPINQIGSMGSGLMNRAIHF